MLPTLAFGCDGADEPPPVEATRRDSAGIELVENHVPRLGADSAWTMEATPSVSIGINEHLPMQQLDRVAGAVRLESGTIVVLNGSPPHLRWYGADGTFLHAAGGRGSGPGEFPNANFTHLWDVGGGRVGTWEYSARRMQVFGPTGQFMSSMTLRHDFGGHPVMVGRFVDGSYIVHRSQVYNSRMPTGTVQRGTLNLFVVDSTGSAAVPIGEYPGSETVVLSTTMPFAYPYAVQPVFLVGRDRFYYGLPNSFEVEVRERTGRLLFITRRADAPRPFDANTRTAFETAVLDAESPARASLVRTTFAEIPWPETEPAYGGMLEDSEGNLWVREYTPAFTWPAFRHTGPDTLTWWVFGRDGSWTTTLRVSSSVDVRQIGADFILGLGRTELGTEAVHLHRLRKTAR